MDTLCHRQHPPGGQFLLAQASMAHALLDSAEAMQDADRADAEIGLARETMHSLNRNLVASNLAAELPKTVEASRDRLRARLLLIDR